MAWRPGEEAPAATDEALGVASAAAEAVVVVPKAVVAVEVVEAVARPVLGAQLPPRSGPTTRLLVRSRSGSYSANNFRAQASPRLASPRAA